MHNDQTIEDVKNHRHNWNIKLEEMAWAMFLIMIGVLWLLPDGKISPHTWLIGAGLIMLGMNFARYFLGIRMSGFTVFLGTVALVAGISGMYALNLPIFSALLIVVGLSLLLRALFKKRV